MKNKKLKPQRIKKESDERYTPEEILGCVRQVGSIVLDPCTTPDNRTKAEHFFIFEDNGLEQEWYENFKDGLIFVNPPFSKLRLWMNKCVKEAEKGCQIIALLPGDTSTLWFHNYVGISADNLCFYKGRIEFLSASDKFGSGAMTSTIFAYWGKQQSKFESVFNNIGLVINLNKL